MEGEAYGVHRQVAQVYLRAHGPHQAPPNRVGRLRQTHVGRRRPRKAQACRPQAQAAAANQALAPVAVQTVMVAALPIALMPVLSAGNKPPKAAVVEAARATRHVRVRTPAKAAPLHRLLLPSPPLRAPADAAISAHTIQGLRAL